MIEQKSLHGTSGTAIVVVLDALALVEALLEATLVFIGLDTAIEHGKHHTKAEKP